MLTLVGVFLSLSWRSTTKDVSQVALYCQRYDPPPIFSSNHTQNELSSHSIFNNLALIQSMKNKVKIVPFTGDAHYDRLSHVVR